MIRGAASFENILRTWIFTRSQIIDTIFFRGHDFSAASGGLGFYWDYHTEALPLVYRSQLVPDGVEIDGVADFPGVNVSVLTPDDLLVGLWEQVSGPSGGLAFDFRQTRPFGGQASLNEMRRYYHDDASFDDGTGDDPGVYGGHGYRFLSVVDTELSPVEFQLTIRPLPADAESLGSAFWALVNQPPVITVHAR
jgi:hypothetical protein